MTKCAACGEQKSDVRIRSPAEVELCRQCLAEGMLWACQQRAVERKREAVEAAAREAAEVAAGGR